MFCIPMTCDPYILMEAVQDALRPEDLRGIYKDQYDPACPVTGHCALAVDVLQALLWECGDRRWKGRNAKDPKGGVHHWLVDSKTGEILDPTAEQYTYYDEEPPYERGRPGGPQGTRWPTINGKKVRRPSNRAMTVIQRMDVAPARALVDRFSGRTAGGVEDYLYHTTSYKGLLSILESGEVRPGGFSGGDSFVSFSEKPVVIPGQLSESGVSIAFRKSSLSPQLLKVVYDEGWFWDHNDQALYITGARWFKHWSAPDYCYDEEGEQLDCYYDAYDAAEVEAFIDKEQEAEWVSKRPDAPVSFRPEDVVDVVVHKSELEGPTQQFFSEYKQVYGSSTRREALPYKPKSLGKQINKRRADEARKFLTDLYEELKSSNEAELIGDCCLWDLPDLRTFLYYLTNEWERTFSFADPAEATSYKDMISGYDLYGRYPELSERILRAYDKLLASAQEGYDANLSRGDWGDILDTYDYDHGEGSFKRSVVPLLRKLTGIPTALATYKKFIDNLVGDYEWGLHKSQQYWKNSEDPHPPGVEDLEVVWHATTAYNPILEEGFKLRSQLESSGGLGGSMSLDWEKEGLSFTGNQEIAEAILESYWDMAELLQGDRTKETFMEFAYKLQVPDETIIDYIRSLNAMKPGESTTPRGAFNIIRNIIGQASALGTYYDPVFMSEKGTIETFMKMKPNDAGVIEAVIDTTNPDVQYIRSMDEWRVPLEAIVSYGPVGSQRAKVEKVAAVTYKQGIYVQALIPEVQSLVASYYRQYEPGPLQHRRSVKTIPLGNVILFCDDEDRNRHYGQHVWTLRTELPYVPDYVVQFAADYYGIDIEEAEELVDPPNIVDTAAAWDDPSFVYDVWAAFEDPGYRTYDGAIVLDRESVEMEYHYDEEGN